MSSYLFADIQRFERERLRREQRRREQEQRRRLELARDENRRKIEELAKSAESEAAKFSEADSRNRFLDEIRNKKAAALHEVNFMTSEKSICYNSLASLNTKIREAVIDEAAKKSLCEKLSTQINDTIAALLSDINAANFTNDIKKLERAANATTAKPLTERVASRQKLLREIKQLADDINFAAKIDISNIKLDTLEAIITQKSPNTPPDKSAKHREEIALFAALLETVMPETSERWRSFAQEADKKETLPSRVQAIREQLKLTYTTYKETTAYTQECKKELAALINSAKREKWGCELITTMEELCRRAEITRNAFEPIITRALSQKAQSEAKRAYITEVLHDTAEIISDLGYTIDGPDGNNFAQVGTLHYVDIGEYGYRARIKISESGKLSARLVRVVATEEERAYTSDNQRLTDIEVGHKWCKSMDKILERLKESGVAVTTNMRIEPEGEEMLVIVAPEMAERRTQQAAQNIERKMSL